MRGRDERCEGLFSYGSGGSGSGGSSAGRSAVLVDEALDALSAFARLYSKTGRPSIAPERLLRALLLQAFDRSARMEQLDYNLLFRWFVGLSMDAPVTVGRDRLVAGDVAARFLQAVLAARG